MSALKISSLWEEKKEFKQLPHAQGFCEGFSQTQQGKWDSGRLCNQWFFPAPEKGQIDLNIQIKTCNRMGHEIQYLQN